MAKKYRLAAQMYGFRDFTKTPKDMVSTIGKIKKMGYDYLQISAFGPIEPAELKKICDDGGVEAIGAHVGLNQFRADEAKVIADCQAWGVSYVAIPSLNTADYKTLADWKKLFREFEGYAKRFAKHGLVVQYHNHAFEFAKFGIKKGAGGKTILDMLYDSTTVLQAEPDFGWIARGGYNPVLWAKKLKGRMDQVHLKDWGIIDNEPQFRAIGEGSLDYPAIIKVCKASGTKDFIVEQDSWKATGDPFVSYAVSRRNLTTMGL